MMYNSNSAYKLAELVHGLDATIKGDPDCLINGISPLQDSKSGHITFLNNSLLNNSLYRKYLPITQASAVILTEQDIDQCPTNAVICVDPYYTYAKIAGFFIKESPAFPGIHPTAIVNNDSLIDVTVSIGAHCVIGSRVKIGPHVVIGAGCIVDDDVLIDEGVRLEPHVTIHRQVTVGKRSRIASGAVIGSEGFGYANHKGVWHSVPQLGGVLLGDDVDVGANTTIDRGAIENTVIENGVKLDNLIQVGHNVRIGAHTIIAGCVAIAGSTVIGKYCMVGGGTRFAGHINICDKVIITGMTAVTKSILEPGMYSSGIVGAVPNQEFRKNNARFHRLEHLMQRVKKLENTLKAFIERKES